MKTIHKELLCLATSYLDLFISDKNNIVDSDIEELFDFCRKEVFFTVCNQNQKLVVKYTDDICNKIQLATAGKDLEVNVLAFALQSCFVLVEHDAYSLSKGMKLKRLTRDIFEKIENSVGFDDAMKNSVTIICKIVDKYGDE